MFRSALVIFFLATSIFSKAQDLKKSPAIEVLNFRQFEAILHKANDTLYLVNFWASWCGPCREEFPALQQAAKKYSNSKFRLVMVSLDFPSQLETKLRPYLRSNPLIARLILLNDTHQNEWIDKVDPKWSGEIPFSLIYKNDKRISYAHSFSTNELDSILNLKIVQL